MSSTHSPRGISICAMAAIKLAIWFLTLCDSVLRDAIMASLIYYLNRGSILSHRSWNLGSYKIQRDIYISTEKMSKKLKTLIKSENDILCLLTYCLIAWEEIFGDDACHHSDLLTVLFICDLFDARCDEFGLRYRRKKQGVSISFMVISIALEKFIFFILTESICSSNLVAISLFINHLMMTAAADI